jgi:hypothetical protein
MPSSVNLPSSAASQLLSFVSQPDLALDTTVLWDRYCMIHLSVVCCGHAVPLLWRVLEHGSATVAFDEYQYRGVLRKARWLLRHHPDVMLLAERGLANHQLLQWLRASRWRTSVQSGLSHRQGCQRFLGSRDRRTTQFRDALAIGAAVSR